MELRSFFYKTLIVLGTLAGLYTLFQLRSILLLFFGAILFASTVRPLVLFFSRRGVPAIASILGIYLVFLAGVIGVFIILLPGLVTNLQTLVNSQSSILLALEKALERLASFVGSGAGMAIPIPRVAELQAYLADLQKSAQAQLDATLFDSIRVISEAVILFVLAFYWLTERDHLEELSLKMLPLRNRERFITILNDIENTLGAYVRGQTILCAAVGVAAFAVLLVLDVRSALLLGVFAGVAEAIPMIGPIIGGIPAILIALLDSPEKALLVTVAYIVIQQIESQVLVPKVMERQVGLSPLFVLLALTAGNLLGGIIGALVAIPIAAALRVLIKELIVVPTVESRKFPVVEGGAILLSDQPVPAASDSVPEVAAAAAAAAATAAAAAATAATATATGPAEAAAPPGSSILIAK